MIGIIVSKHKKMRLFSKILFCGFMVAVLQTAAAPPAGAQSASDDNTDKLSVPFNPENAGALSSQVRHTPSGQMYTIPAAEPEKTFWGSFEVGISASTGDTNNAKFREYQDTNGPAINNFDLSGEH
jgi:hypothetical protein